MMSLNLKIGVRTSKCQQNGENIILFMTTTRFLISNSILSLEYKKYKNNTYKKVCMSLNVCKKAL